MSKGCVLAFFDDAYQRELKISCQMDIAFEDVLIKYRDSFLIILDELIRMEVNKTCTLCGECLMRVPLFGDYERYLNDFLDDVATRKDLIKELFDEVISVYIGAISKNRAIAMHMMKKYIDNRCGYFNVDGVMIFSRPMFRARKVGTYDGSNIHELFHVPFDKRYNIGNQRFSLAGMPLLYMAESLPLALQEIECNIQKSNAAVFLPNFSLNFREGMYDLSNPIAQNLINAGTEMMVGFKLTYDHDMPISFKKSDIHQYLARFILSQIMHYPVDINHRGGFIQEYVLPQLMMDLVNEKSWIGVSYSSCKEYKWKRNDFEQCSNRNMCFNVPYVKDKYNEDLLKKLFYATWCNGEDILSYGNLINKMSDIKALIDKGRDEGFNMTDYIAYYGRIKMHVETMEKILGKRVYRSRTDCKVEMTLLYKLLQKIELIVADPEKSGIIKMK